MERQRKDNRVSEAPSDGTSSSKLPEAPAALKGQQASEEASNEKPADGQSSSAPAAMQDCWRRSLEEVREALEALTSCRTETQEESSLMERFDAMMTDLKAYDAKSDDGAQEFVRMVARELSELAKDLGDAAPSPLADAVTRTLAVLHPIRARVTDPEGDNAWEEAQSAFPVRVSSTPRRPSRISHHERRSEQRVALDVNIGLYSDSNFYTGFVEDISSGGLFVGTYRDVPMGTLVELSFVLPNEHHVVTQGVVRWLRDGNNEMNPGVGVAFTTLSEEDRQAIETFMAHRSPLFYDE